MDGQAVYLEVMPNGVLAFKAECGNCRRKAFVISMPKSGTYLIAKILSELGLVDVEIHAAPAVVTDYRDKTIDDKIGKARQYVRYLPIEISSSLIHEGQFAVGHLPYDWRHISASRDFARIVTVRNPRDALVSMMRFEMKRMLADPERDLKRRSWIELPSDASEYLGF
jgi:hypothetical protein